MQVSLIVGDIWASAALLPAEDMLSAYLERCPGLVRARWSVHVQTPLQALSDILPGVNAYHSLLPEAMSAEWCLLPVHLALQRDSFSLQGIVPLAEDVYEILSQILAQHFAEQFQLMPDPDRRCWWVQTKQALDARAPWPQDCLFRQAMMWQPSGADGHLIRQWGNEMQMLLHQLSNAPPLDYWPQLLNSLWLARLPLLHSEFDQVTLRLSGRGRLFERVKQLHRFSSVVASSAVWLKPDKQDIVYLADTPEDVDWPALNEALNSGRIKRLHLVLPYAEQHVRVEWQSRWRWQFWRRTQSLQSLHTQLSAALSAQLPVMKG